MQVKFIHYHNMKIKADIGKVFRRIADKQIFGNEVVLGYNYVLHGQILPKAYLELPEHYEQIPDPELDLPLLEEGEEIEVPQEDDSPRIVTMRDYIELEGKVNKLMKLIEWQDSEIQE